MTGVLSRFFENSDMLFTGIVYTSPFTMGEYTLILLSHNDQR